MSDRQARPVVEFTVDSLRVVVHESRASLGWAAAETVASIIADRQRRTGQANVIFAAAPSQNEFLDSLAGFSGLDWSKVKAFHMDEYLGLDQDHPASFRRYLKEHLFQKTTLSNDNLHLIPGEETNRPLKTSLAYEQLILDHPPDLICGGVGENGHLAFNDPPVADFLDPVLVKVVRLDHACRVQQLNDECFAKLEDVPTHAYTLTIPVFMTAKHLSIVVPGSRKAEAVRAALRGPIDETCPASILRNHPSATLYLDLDSAKYIL